MAPPSSNPAAHAVLDTIELLCEIIGRLPLNDIVIATSVCRTWRNPLQASVAIQQALFLVPAGPREITTTTKCLSERVTDIPRMQYAIVGEPNPYTARIFGLMYPSTVPSWNRPYETNNAPMLDFEHPAGTWREMTITQPPIKAIELALFAKEIHLFSRSDGYTESYKHHVPYDCDEGIKLGLLHDFIASTLKA